MGKAIEKKEIGPIEEETVKATERNLEDELNKGINRELKAKKSLKDNLAGEIGDPPESEVPEKDVYQALDENEDGDAALFIRLFIDKRLYDYAENQWYYFNGHFWCEDRLNHTRQLMNEVVGLFEIQRQRELWKLRKLERDPNMSQEKKEKEIDGIKRQIKALSSRKDQLQTLRRKNSVLRLAADGQNSLGYEGDGWDSDPWRLGCRNGVINLKTGAVVNGRPDDYIKTVSPIPWDHDANCPTWERFLLEVFEEDQELVNFMQRLFGYAITGLREEHIYPILWGEHGRNGKSTIFEILKYILGPMAYKAPTHIVMHGLHSTSTGPNASLMKFRGARIVWTSEANKKDHLDTAAIKSLSGGDTITARNPYGRREVSFLPTHTLFTIVNPLPKVDADDDAMWNRVVLIPFQLSFVDDPKKPWEKQRDPKLFEKLKKEAPGILKWLVNGCRVWRKEGLNPPTNLTAAKGEYRENEDIVGHFLSDKEYCKIDIGNGDMRETPRRVYNRYVDWCKDSGFNKLNQKHFKEILNQKLGKPQKSYKFYYHGITIIGGVILK